MFAEVIVPVPVEGTFTYIIPPELDGRVKAGMRVRVPFGQSKTHVGIVAGIHSSEPEGFELKCVLEVKDEQEVVLPVQLSLWKWIADYYMAPIGDVYKAAMPQGMKTEQGLKPKTELYVRLAPPFRTPQAIDVARGIIGRAIGQQKAFETLLGLLKAKAATNDPSRGAIYGARPAAAIPYALQESVTKEELLNEAHCSAAIFNALISRGILETYRKEVGRLNLGGAPCPENIKTLSEAQQKALDGITASFEEKNVTLLHGVTSSGKTEIYIHLIQREIDRGGQVLFLLPEIALTVQIMERLRRVFGRRLGIYHSRYSDAERVEIWQKQLSGEPYDIILGARSAVFLPMKRLSLVIVDEEHEGSFKQQDPAPRYHARSVAIMLASMSGAKVLLGSATPSIETYHNSKRGKYGYVTLNQRYEGVLLPKFTIVDTADLRFRKMMEGPFSPELLGHMRKALERGKQVILFQNRRGYAPMLLCKSCGWTPRCPNCDVTLTVHKSLNMLTCHYCGATFSIPSKCPCCEESSLRERGYGTEKIEDGIRAVFPEAKVARMDLDTTRTKDAYSRIINDFSEGRTDILIGTQMVSKGLDFGGVSVVGILNADTMLKYPDFRAYEHGFQMMAQVGGRAGRRGEQGVVIVQTADPKQAVFPLVISNDYDKMYQNEAGLRQMFHYPPYFRLIYIYMKHKNNAVVEDGAAWLAGLLRPLFGERLLGPAKPEVARVKMLFIRKMVLKLEPGIDMTKVRRCLYQCHRQLLADKRFNSIYVYYDVDPE